MNWEPISEAELRDEINRGYRDMSPPQRRLWEAIKIHPRKWKLHPWGDEGGGFWVVAILGETVVWYNDIEDGFNRSVYENHGVIRDYQCNQDELSWTVRRILDAIETGEAPGGYRGPPEPIE